jgi:hypothetical protein
MVDHDTPDPVDYDVTDLVDYDAIAMPMALPAK